MKKAIGIFALVAASGLASVVGCSSVPADPGTPDPSTPETGTPTPTPTKDASPDVERPITCYDEGAALALTGVAPTKGSNKCGAGKIAEFKAACFGSGGNCQQWIDANKDCGRCLIGPLQGDDAKTTPIGVLLPIDDTTVTVNIPSCASDVIGRADCSLKLATQTTCLNSACATCEDDAADTACSNQAAAGICKTVMDEACTKAVNDAQTQWAATCRGTNFDDTFAKVAEYFCGAGSTDAGGGG